MSERIDPRLQDFARRMDAAIDVLQKEFVGVRAGRANVNLLDPVKVDAYGSLMPLSQVGTVGAPEPRLLTVQVWDKGMVKATEKALRESNLGLNPQIDGQMIRVTLPDLTEDRRKDLVKIASGYTEDTKIAVRNVRRDGMDSLKKLEKDKEISEDERKRLETEVQTMTDARVKRADELFSTKQKEIMQV